MLRAGRKKKHTPYAGAAAGTRGAVRRRTYSTQTQPTNNPDVNNFIEEPSSQSNTSSPPTHQLGQPSTEASVVNSLPQQTTQSSGQANLATVVASNNESKPACEGKMDNKTRIIAMRVSEESTCAWIIKAPENHGVWFLLSALRVTKLHSTCSNYLRLEEVHVERRTLLKNYCSSLSRDHVKTRHNQVKVSAYNVTFKLTWNVFVLGKANRRKNVIPTTQKYSQTTESIIKENTFIAFLKEQKYSVLGILAGMLTTVIITFITMKICSKSRRNQRVINTENYEMHTLPGKSDHKNERPSQLIEECKLHEQEDDYENIKTTDFHEIHKKEMTDIRRQKGRDCNPQEESESSLESWCSYPSHVTHDQIEYKNMCHSYQVCQGRIFRKESHEYQTYRKKNIEDSHLHNETYQGTTEQNMSPSVSISSSDCENYVNLY